MNVDLRRLSKDDVGSLSALNVLFGNVFGDPESYHEHAPTEAYLASFLADPRHIVVVAESEGEIVGGSVAYVMKKYEQERSEVYVYDLAVSDAVQGQGIGTQLMAKIREIAKQTGAYVVWLQADEGDRAVQFYESLDPSESTRTHSFDFKA